MEEGITARNWLSFILPLAVSGEPSHGFCTVGKGVDSPAMSPEKEGQSCLRNDLTFSRADTTYPDT